MAKFIKLNRVTVGGLGYHYHPIYINVDTIMSFYLDGRFITIRTGNGTENYIRIKETIEEILDIIEAAN